MEDQEFIAISKQFDAKLERSLALNEKLLQELLAQKIQFRLRHFTVYKSFGILAYLLWLFLLGSVIYYALINDWYFWRFLLGSAGMIALINIKGLSDYVRHLALKSEIQYNGSILEIQQKLLEIQVSMIHHLKYSFLQLPFFTFLYLNDVLLQHAGLWFWLNQAFISICMMGLSLWLFINLDIKNKDKRWFRYFIDYSGQGIADALEFCREMENMAAAQGE